MNKDLTKLALRYGALYLPDSGMSGSAPLSAEAAAFAATLAQNGYTLSEDALRAVAAATPEQLTTVLDAVFDVYGVGRNWAPMVKAWKTPTGVDDTDYIVTMFANLFPGSIYEGTTLPCGHFIPAHTFPLERYNGCPFCGTPFEFSAEIFTGQGSKMKVLTLWHDDDMKTLRDKLSGSTVPLDGTQPDTLARLTAAYGLPQVRPAMKETAVLLAAALYDDDPRAALALLDTPADILRFIWYKKTGQLKVIRPQALITAAAAACSSMPAVVRAAEEKRKSLRLHFSRTECAAFADRLDTLGMTVEAMCESMHPDRQMWVRVIRALRLSEYSRGREHLSQLMDAFYNQRYTPWAGLLEQSRLRRDADATFALLRSRPGLFARSLFANMLTFGPERALAEFAEVSHHVSPRLLLSLADNAETYFLPDDDTRTIFLPGGRNKTVPLNPALARYSLHERRAMIEGVKGLYLEAMRRHYAAQPHTPGSSIYITPELFDIPVPVGDRATSIQDASAAVTGQRFAVEGDEVRLFMQWGNGLPAQHLDMDLSAYMIRTHGEPYQCSYYALTVPGAQHSGDIIHIPDMVGTAEYIELRIEDLIAADVRYVAFTCNAYSNGAVSPGLIVGWMDSRYPMKVDDATGVAYDPSTVSHMVRISASNLAKGLVFGILDVYYRTITWLEMPFAGRTARELDERHLTAMLRRLRNKTTLGQVLAVKAEAQNLVRTDNPAEADEVYTDLISALGAIV